MAVRGRGNYLPCYPTETSSTAEMGAAFLNTVNDMEGPNSVTSSPSPYIQMESDSPQQLSLWTLDETLTLGDFVNPLDIFNSSTKTTNENVCQQQSANTSVNVFEDLEACPIDIEDILRDSTSVDELCNIVLELEEATGVSSAPFDLVSYVEQQPEPPRVSEPQPLVTAVPSTSKASPVLSTIDEAVLDVIRTAPCTPEPVVVHRNFTVKKTRPAVSASVEPKTKKVRSSPEASPAAVEDVKRERNKQASRKSRQKRKLRDAEMHDEALKLEHHNKILLEQITALENLKKQIEAEIKKHFPALSR